MVEAPGIEVGESIPVSTSLDNVQLEYVEILEDISSIGDVESPVLTNDDHVQRKIVSSVSEAVDRALNELNKGYVGRARGVLETLRNWLATLG